MTKINESPYAIIVGLDTMVGIQAARILYKRKVPVIAIAKNPNHICSKTRVCKKILFADTSNSDFIETLKKLGPKLKQKGVLFPCNDSSVLFISRNRKILSTWYHIVLPESNIVEMLMDKVKFYDYAQTNGLSIPRTYIIKNRKELDQVIKNINFPCILKPPNSAAGSWEGKSKFKAYKVFNTQELLDIYEQCKGLTDILLIQEWIEGPNLNLYSCNCYFNSDSEPLASFTARKIRQWPPEAGESSLGEECRSDEVHEETMKLFRGVKFYGLGYLEMKKDDRDGKFYIIEPNIGRPTGRSAISEAGGVELLYTMYCDSLDLPLPVNGEQKYSGVKWICLRSDLRSSLYYWKRGELTIIDWIKSIRGKKAYAYFAWYDPVPFIIDIGRAVRLIFSREGRQKLI